jgi:hypothetical protein
LESWKKKESECQSVISRLKNEIKRAHESEQKAIVVSVHSIRFDLKHYISKLKTNSYLEKRNTSTRHEEAEK